jgi:hypothetical protein
MRILIAALLLLMACPVFSASLCVATTTGVKTAIPIPIGKPPTVNVVGSMTVTSGSGTAAVSIESSLDGVHYVQVGTLSVTNTANDANQYNFFGYGDIRCNVTAISGTGASLTVTERAR